MSSTNLKILEQALNFSAAKQKVISKNIANIGTVNYRREVLEFDEILSNELSGKMKVTNEKHFGSHDGESDEYSIVKDQSNENISGFNNVDVNKEMSDLAENSIVFRFAARKLNGHFSTLQSVIKGSR